MEIFLSKGKTEGRLLLTRNTRTVRFLLINVFLVELPLTSQPGSIVRKLLLTFEELSLTSEHRRRIRCIVLFGFAALRSCPRGPFAGTEVGTVSRRAAASVRPIRRIQTTFAAQRRELFAGGYLHKEKEALKAKYDTTRKQFIKDAYRWFIATQASQTESERLQNIGCTSISEHLQEQQTYHPLFYFSLRSIWLQGMKGSITLKDDTVRSRFKTV